MRDLSRRGMEYIIIELCICTWRVFCQNFRPFVFDIFNTDILPYYLDCASVWKNGVLSSSMQSILCCPRTTYLLKDFLNLRHALLKFLFELFSWTLVYVLVCTKKFPPPQIWRNATRSKWLKVWEGKKEFWLELLWPSLLPLLSVFWTVLTRR